MSFLMVGRPPFGASTMDQVLLVVNTASQNSIDAANYYVQYRPGAGSVDVVPINCVTTETITYSTYQTNIKAPIEAWIASKPLRPKKYILLSMDIPTGISFGPSGINPSVAVMLSTARNDASISTGSNNVSEYAATQGGIFNAGGDGGVLNTHFTTGGYPNTKYLVTHLCMGNAVASVTAYVDKIALMYKAMATPDVTVSSRNAGLNGTKWYFDDTDNTAPGSIASPYNLITGTDGLSTSLAVLSSSTGPVISAPSDPAFYQTWGVHNGSFNGTWPSNGQLVLSGKCNWFITAANESFNGNLTGGMGDYGKWWAATGGGGTNYSSTPIGFVGHILEPFVAGCEAESYARNWFKGLNFAETAWSARSTLYYIAVGDPLVAW